MTFRLITAALVLTFVLSPVCRAFDTSIGVTGGALMTLPSEFADADDRTFTGFIGGIIAEVPVHSILSVRTGLLYRSEGTWFPPVTWTDINGQDLGRSAYSEDFSWFEIPVLAKLTPISTPLYPYALAGANLYIMNNAEYAGIPFPETGDRTDSFKSATVGLTAGVGAGWNISSLAEVFIEGRYAQSLGSILKEGDRSNPSIAVTTGVLVHL